MMGLWCTQMGVGGWVTMVALWLAVVALVVWAVCRLFPARRGPDPQTILDERLATGEIDADTYRSLRGLLEGREPGEAPSAVTERRP